MVSEINLTIPRTTFKNGGSVAVGIPTELASALGIDIGSDVQLSLMSGRHGKFIAIWKTGNGNTATAGDNK
jgi:antitoxin component of MazEF toxin-antitoxin module